MKIEENGNFEGSPNKKKGQVDMSNLFISKINLKLLKYIAIYIIYILFIPF